MAIIQRSSARYTQRKHQHLPLSQRLQRRRRGQLVCGGSLARAVIALFIIILISWIIGILVFSFGFSELMAIHGGTGTLVSSLKFESRNMDNASIKNRDKQIYDSRKFESPLLIITCKRPNYLSKTLESVLAAMSIPCEFGCPVIIAEDGVHKEIEEVVLSYQEKFEAKEIPLIHIHHERVGGLKGNPYEVIAKHYGWALSHVFDGNAFFSNINSTQKKILPRRVVILEEDIKVAPDFFTYMEATSSLLDHDPTIYAVSAFNDNGHLRNADPKRVLRSDFFPGLGWMMNRDLWINELKSKWPNGYWDDWLREGAQRKDRQVIRPEASRSYHFGTKGGASANQFGSMLERNNLNSQSVQWDTEDLSYLENSLYEKKYMKLVLDSKLVHSIEEAKHASQDIRMEYDSISHFSRLATQFGIMNDEKAMVPRTAYRGIVEVRQGSSLLYLTPKGGFTGYKNSRKNL